MGVCGLVFLLLTRTPLKHRRLRRSSPRSNQTSIRQGDPCTGVRTPPGMERAPLYRYFDDTTPLVPAPACVAAQALERRQCGGHTPRSACSILELCCWPGCRQLWCWSSARLCCQRGNTSVREMYLNIDAASCASRGTVRCTSCSCRPGPLYRALVMLAYSGSRWQAQRKLSAAVVQQRRYAFI